MYSLYGLLIDSIFPLGIESTSKQAPVDWTIRWSPTAIEIPTDLTPLADGLNWPAYVAESGDAFLVSRHGNGTVRIGRTTHRIHLDLRDRSLELGTLLLRGVVLSMALELSGVPVLHANGLELRNGGIAIAGPQGAGKTTVSAALAAAGVPLVTDDVVALDNVDGDLYMRAGLTDLRLRKTAAAILRLFPDSPSPTPTTLDGRLVLQRAPYHRESLRLNGIVIPITGHSRTSVVTMDRASSLRYIMNCFRVPSFHRIELSRQRLETLSSIVSSLPTAALRMPTRTSWTKQETLDLRSTLEDWIEESARVRS